MTADATKRATQPTMMASCRYMISIGTDEIVWPRSKGKMSAPMELEPALGKVTSKGLYYKTYDAVITTVAV